MSANLLDGSIEAVLTSRTTGQLSIVCRFNIIIRGYHQYHHFGMPPIVTLQPQRRIRQIPDWSRLDAGLDAAYEILLGVLLGMLLIYTTNIYCTLYCTTVIYSGIEYSVCKIRTSISRINRPHTGHIQLSPYNTLLYMYSTDVATSNSMPTISISTPAVRDAYLPLLQHTLLNMHDRGAWGVPRASGGLRRCRIM